MNVEEPTTPSESVSIDTSVKKSRRNITPNSPSQIHTSHFTFHSRQYPYRLRPKIQLAYLGRKSLTSSASPESLTVPPLLLGPVPAGRPIRLFERAPLALDGNLLCRGDVTLEVGLNWVGKYGKDFISSYLYDLEGLIEEGVLGPGRGEEIVDDLSRNDSAKEPFEVVPSDVRFAFPATG